MRAYAWPLLVQAGGLAERHGKKLALTAAGRAALAQPGAPTLRRLWQYWVKNKQFDELNRIDAIKGQRGKGKRSLTPPPTRRQAVEAGLAQCPRGEWVSLAAFSRYLLAAGHRFEVSRQPWDLYIGEAQYGSLGYQGSHDWNILQQRYLGCLLFEIAATLGMLDVAYVEPWEVPSDFRDLWGTDDLAFLSRCDGLLHFRLNPLGCYCLGLADEYRPSVPAARGAVRVLPNRHIEANDCPLAAEEALLLDAWAQRLDDGVWCLDRDKILSLLESGRPLDDLREFLAARDPQELPETVGGFLTTLERQATALRNAGNVLLIECADEAFAERVAGDRSAGKLCIRLGPKHLGVKPEKEERFRRAVHELGLGMPR